jgi:hypothetical protein
VRGIKYLVHEAKQLQPQKIGRTLVFTEADIEAYRARRAERAAVAALPPEAKHRRHRDQQAESERRRYRQSKPG